jgi:hypothetical protein
MKIKYLLLFLLLSKSIFSQTVSTNNPNVSPLRGMTANLFKDVENTESNFAFQVKIRNVIQENGLIKISLYTNINEPSLYLVHNCAKDGFDLYKDARFNPKKDFFITPNCNLLLESCTAAILLLECKDCQSQIFDNWMA